MIKFSFTCTAFTQSLSVLPQTKLCGFSALAWDQEKSSATMSPQSVNWSNSRKMSQLNKNLSKNMGWLNRNQGINVR